MYKIAGRELPSFQDWINKELANAGGDHEGFRAYADLVLRTLAQEQPDRTPAELSLIRLFKGMIIATIELCNHEARIGTPTHVYIPMLARAQACAAIYAFGSVAADDAPLRDFAKILTEEFRFAAKQAADDLEAKAREIDDDEAIDLDDIRKVVR